MNQIYIAQCPNCQGLPTPQLKTDRVTIDGSGYWFIACCCGIIVERGDRITAIAEWNRSVSQLRDRADLIGLLTPLRAMIDYLEGTVETREERDLDRWSTGGKLQPDTIEYRKNYELVRSFVDRKAVSEYCHPTPAIRELISLSRVWLKDRERDWPKSDEDQEIIAEREAIIAGRHAIEAAQLELDQIGLMQ